MPHFRRVGILLGLITPVLMCCTSDSCHALVIDDFEMGSLVVERTGDSSQEAAQTGLDPAHVLGGNRYVTVGQFGSATQTLTVDPNAGLLLMEAAQSYGYFEIGYGSDDSPLNVDLTAGNAHAFLVDYSPGEFIPLFRIVVQTPMGTDSVSLGFFAITPFELPNGQMRVRFPFELYPEWVDFENVERVAISIGRQSPDSSFEIHQILTVPEPTTLLLALLLVPIACARRNRRTH